MGPRKRVSILCGSFDPRSAGLRVVCVLVSPTCQALCRTQQTLDSIVCALSKILSGSQSFLQRQTLRRESSLNRKHAAKALRKRAAVGNQSTAETDKWGSLAIQKFLEDLFGRSAGTRARGEGDHHLGSFLTW